MDYYCLKKCDEIDKTNDWIAQSMITEKKSKFISYIYEIENEIQAQSILDKLKKENKDARHIVYLYSYLENKQIKIKYSDDGEPTGTGTKALYEYITQHHITQICIAVVRYFGGILLGAGPLSRTYFNVALSAIQKCREEKITYYYPICFHISYPKWEQFCYQMKNWLETKDVIFETISYHENIEVRAKVEENKYKEVKSFILSFR